MDDYYTVEKLDPVVRKTLEADGKDVEQFVALMNECRRKRLAENAR